MAEVNLDGKAVAAIRDTGQLPNCPNPVVVIARSKQTLGPENDVQSFAFQDGLSQPRARREPEFPVRQSRQVLNIVGNNEGSARLERRRWRSRSGAENFHPLVCFFARRRLFAFPFASSQSCDTVLLGLDSCLTTGYILRKRPPGPLNHSVSGV